MEFRCKKAGDECYGVKELTLLSEISQRLIQTKELKNDLSVILELLVRHLDAERSFLTIFNRQNSKIYIEAAYGYSSAQQARGKYDLGEGIIGRVIELARPIVVDKISESNLFLNRTQQELKSKDGKDLTFVCVPIIEESQVTGALGLLRLYNPYITKDENLYLLSVIGSLISRVVSSKQEQMEELEALRQKNQELQSKLDDGQRPVNIVGNSGKMRDVYSLVNMVAETNSTVLIRGESGIGKELIADAIHYSSKRARNNFVKVNCSALPDSLIESELFGHEKGAFTGADSRRKGRFELADGGTIFLDEIGDIPLSTQVKILRILQQREFERLGGTETIKVDVRIVAATNRNLEEAIEKGEFREDLFYRINVFPLYIPSLRERRDDIPLLVDHFIEKFNKRNGTSVKRITTSALNMLMIYSWPGNIRELENCIERACILTTDDVIHSYNLPPSLQTADSSNTQARGGLMYTVEQVEKQLIREALTSTKGNIAKAAELLSVTERMLGTRVKKYEIEAWRFKV
ncbi:sigma-54-dependent Fis family transcriptional regulator [Mangrovibacterium marinum]|uniref:Nif-specific regulatory protein n=1 Tax=Mangrovibacterium marinum TaxID=1639118 RepID=A0A2T5BZJ7_9BACT|nr:sigma 54-interacting transcriptional regulator [Mangrovibacterium marinum]PTN07698.1 Nif-specific regulatory protein [Mangrovibacterium marinum]